MTNHLHRASRPARRRRTIAVATLALLAASCGADGDDSAGGSGASSDSIVATTPSDDGAPIEYRDETGPTVDDPDRSLAMTVDAVETADDDILVRIRVSNRADDYLDMGVEDTIYGPLLVMFDDAGNEYPSYAVEPAGVPGGRVADLSFRLYGPLADDANTFTLELATQRGPVMSPSARLTDADGVRWRVDDPAHPADDADAMFASPPRLPRLVHFWLETDPLPADD